MAEAFLADPLSTAHSHDLPRTLLYDQSHGDVPMYVSVDIDVLAHAPGTGTSESGGISTGEVAGGAAPPRRPDT